MKLWLFKFLEVSSQCYHLPFNTDVQRATTKVSGDTSGRDIKSGFTDLIQRSGIFACREVDTGSMYKSNTTWSASAGNKDETIFNRLEILFFFGLLLLFLVQDQLISHHQYLLY